MLPIPTRTALAAFTGCVAILALGLATTSLAAVLLASSGFVGLCLALAASMPLGRRVRRERLEFAWWLGHGAAGGAVVPNVPFEVRCYIRHRGEQAVLLGGVKPIVPGGARVLEDAPNELLLRGRARTEFEFRLVAPAAGRVVLHGLAVTLTGPLGLFEVPLYFPNPLGIKVLPRAAATRQSAQNVPGLPVERGGRSAMRRRGGGTEIYELRELQPGDPFKSIAWKASARTGRLMVKEVEREVQENQWIVLDVSGTMRGGPLGSRKLDFAIEAAAAEARRTVEAGDQIGLLTVDGRVLAHVPPREGKPQLLRVYDALLAATEVVDQDLTDVDDAELVSIVGRYVRNQDGIDFALRDRSDKWDRAGLVRQIRKALADIPEKDEIVASDDVSGSLRRFCRARGIPLPYRPDPRDESKAPGLATALKIAGGRSRVASSIVVITDFDGVADTKELLAAVRLVQGHGHPVAFVVPDARAFAPEPVTDLEKRLSEVYGLGESRRVREAREVLGRAGVPVLVATNRDSPALVVRRALRLRRAA